MDTLAQQWQNMGVEIPHDQKLEDTLSEVSLTISVEYKHFCKFFIFQSLVIDASRRVNVSDVATTLESAVMNDSQNSSMSISLAVCVSVIGYVLLHIYSATSCCIVDF